MNTPPTENGLRTIIESNHGCDLAAVGPDDDLVVELGLDSMASLRVLAVIEKTYGRRFPDDRLGEFRTLNQLLEYQQETKGELE